MRDGREQQGVGALDLHPHVLLAQQGLMHGMRQQRGREVRLLRFDD